VLITLFTECTFIVLTNEEGGSGAASPSSEIDRMVGDVNIFLHDEADRGNAEIEVMIAEPTSRRKGYGKEALLMMLRYGIQQLSVTRFFAKISATNESSIALFKRYSFLTSHTSLHISLT
jgi:RimJ/RimL family protein N-acetyltransferase